MTITAAAPAAPTTVFDDLGLPASELEFIPLVNAHSDPGASAHPATAVTTLLRVAVATSRLVDLAAAAAAEDASSHSGRHDEGGERV